MTMAMMRSKMQNMVGTNPYAHGAFATVIPAIIPLGPVDGILGLAPPMIWGAAMAYYLSDSEDKACDAMKGAAGSVAIRIALSAL